MVDASRAVVSGRDEGMVHDDVPLPRGERHAQCTTPTTGALTRVTTDSQ